MRQILLLLLGLSLSFVIGCKKQKPAEAAPPSAAADAATPETPATVPPQPATPVKQQGEKLRGASVVRDDLKKKDYSRAVEGLLVLRGFAVNEEQWIEYRELSGEVGRVLAAAAPTEPNAAVALGAYRVAMYGR